MFDTRPAAYVIGLLVTALGITMVVPMAMELYDQNGQWWVFALSGLITGVIGGTVALACANSATGALNIQQTFLLTTVVWVVLPVFGAIPFVVGATDARIVDAFFEAMSGMTTTGSTVLSGLDDLPRGLLLWRAMMQWFGGIGIVVVAMAFLPVLRVGGMQIFKSEAFDTFGKVLPRAAEIASRISVIYVGLTVACFLAYEVSGLSTYDAVYHALTTISTGGFSNYDASFGAHKGAPEYVASVFMILAALPFVRYVQIVGGSVRPFFQDTQVRGVAVTYAVIVVVLLVNLHLTENFGGEEEVREALFNVASILTGTGFASVDYQLWGGFPIALFFMIGLVGGSAGSTSCSVKVFRYQILFSTIATQIRRIHSPNGVFSPRFMGRPVSDDIIGSVMAFFMLFFASLAVLSVALAMTGLDMITAVSGAATALANIGPGLGPEIGPSGNFAGLNDTAKWLLSAGMLVGRLELMAVFVLFTRNFWRS